MPKVQIPARDFILEVSDGAATPTWLEVDGFTSVTVNRSENEETANTTTFSSDGYYEQEIAQRGAIIEVEGRLLLDPATGEQDPGQARCDELATKVMRESLGLMRFRYPSQTDWTQWSATFTSGESGGETNNKATWAMTFTRSGKSTSVSVA